MFKKTTRCISVFLLTLPFSSCKNEPYIPKDFTKDALFTKGIEGPAVNSQGMLFAVNFSKEGTIGKVTMDGTSSLFTTLPKGSIGNGIRFDAQDNMYIADYTNHSVLQIKKGTTNAIIYARDTTLNQPNDLAIAPNGTLYASDPDWKNDTGNLWLVKDQQFVLLEKNMGTTNGIEVSPDGKTLYVNESVQRTIWKYDIMNDGNITNKQLFTTFPDFGLDGMRCDIKGNVYVCRYGKGTVAIFSAEGVLLREVLLKGKNPTNIAFGRTNTKQCFITLADRGSIETFYAEHAGKGF